MAESPARTKPAVTRRQVMVIAVLGVILAVVMIAQFGGASGRPVAPQPSEPQPAASVPQPGTLQPRAAASQPGTPRPGAAGPRKDATPWPKLGAQAAAQYDPFAMPEPLARQTAPQRSQKALAAKPAPNPAADPVLAALRSKGTHALFRDGDRAAAVIDNRVVHVGDVLQGYRVVSIDDDGVLVTPSGSQDAREDRK